jgi:hypothetical protein
MLARLLRVLAVPLRVLAVPLQARRTGAAIGARAAIYSPQSTRPQLPLPPHGNVRVCGTDNHGLPASIISISIKIPRASNPPGPLPFPLLTSSIYSIPRRRRAGARKLERVNMQMVIRHRRRR